MRRCHGHPRWYLGLASWLRLWWLVFLSPVVVWFVSRWVISREEEYLTRKFGAVHTTYQARVRRWV